MDSHITATAFLDRARSTLISGLLRNLLLGLLLTAMFHVMVTKPILAISKSVSKIDPEAPGGHLVEVPRGHDADELGLLVSKTNHFLNAFDASLRERARYADELRGALIRAEEGSRAKSQFLSTMSHELRTPLNAIIGFSELIRDDPAAQAKGVALGDYAQEIHDSGSQLLRIINDLLDLTEIDAGNHTIHPEPLEVSRLLDTCARLVAGTARERKLQPDRRGGAGMPVTDRGRPRGSSDHSEPSVQRPEVHAGGGMGDVERRRRRPWRRADHRG